MAKAIQLPCRATPAARAGSCQRQPMSSGSDRMCWKEILWKSELFENPVSEIYPIIFLWNVLDRDCSSPQFIRKFSTWLENRKTSGHPEVQPQTVTHYTNYINCSLLAFLSLFLPSIYSTVSTNTKPKKIFFCPHQNTSFSWCKILPLALLGEVHRGSSDLQPFLACRDNTLKTCLIA